MKQKNRQQVEVVLDADFIGAACQVGALFRTAAHGRETFSFEYDRAWLNRSDAFSIDPDLQMHGGESYPADGTGVFRIFLDSAPDRWGAAHGFCVCGEQVISLFVDSARPLAPFEHQTAKELYIPHVLPTILHQATYRVRVNVSAP